MRRRPCDRPILAAALGLALVTLAACAPTRGDDDDSAGCVDEATLRVCATYGGEPSAGTAVLRTGPGDDLPIEALLDSDGCADVRVAAGTWEWRARHATDTCESVFTEVDLPACEVTEVNVELIEWCFDGR